MTNRRFGLRAKASLALVLAALVALLPAVLISQKVLDGVRKHFGEAYSVNFTQLKRQSIFSPVSRELALSRRFANSVLTRQWLLDEHDAKKSAAFFQEAEGYRQSFRDHNYFIASALSRNYYTNASDKPLSNKPRYVLGVAKEADSWFFSSLKQAEDFNINVDYDKSLDVTRVWFNFLVRDGARVIAMVGTGLDLSEFVKEFIDTDEPGVTPLIINQSGAIQAHRDLSLIAYNQAGSAANPTQTLAGQLPQASQREALAAAMQSAEIRPGEVSTLTVTLDGREQLLALSYLPELKWHIVTAVDLQAAKVIDKSWLHLAIGIIAGVIVVLLVAFGYAVEALILHPLRTLQHSASAVAEGRFDVSLPPPSQDELGDLSRAFLLMAKEIQSNTEELENKVIARTQALEEANQAMQKAHRKIDASIDYASLIQSAILPDQPLQQALGERHFVLWHPRDIVGGDFYVFRAEGENHLLGVIDCAGHGVPGALMTMLARSALDHAMNKVGIDSPATLLGETDSAIRAMLAQDTSSHTIATNMDAGLVYIDHGNRRLRYAGARISLYWSDGNDVGEIKGARRALVDRRLGVYTDTEIDLRPGITYYLATDGFLDQAGGDMGYGFGNTRFAQLLVQHAKKPMAEQAYAFDEALKAYQGNYPQRDDITLLSFRFN